MSMFGHDHNKVSLKLRQMMAQDASTRELVKAIPAGYYPRLDSEHGRMFLLRYMRNYSFPMDLIETFIARGLDLNGPVDDDNNTILHYMMKDTHTWDCVIEDLIDHFPEDELSAAAENDQGDKPLDIFLQYGGYQFGKRFIYNMIMREAEVFYPTQSPQRTQYLHTRVMQFIEHLDGQDLARLVPKHLPLNMRDRNGQTLFMLLVEKANINVVNNIVQAADFQLPDYKEPVIERMVARFGASSIDAIRKLEVIHQAPVTAAALDAAIASRNIELFDYVMSSLPSRVYAEQLDSAFEKIIQLKDVDFACAAIKSVHLQARDHIGRPAKDIDVPVLEDGLSLLLYSISRGNERDARKLLEAGADIRKADGSGQKARELAAASGNKNAIKLVEDEIKRLNTSGDFELVHKNQMACKKGVLTYIFDFYAGQVVVRDNETKSIATTPFAEFARNGHELLGEAARMLTQLGGDARGFDAPDTLSPAVAKKAAPLIKKPSA